MKSKIFKKNRQGDQRKKGRNHSGRITSRHRGGGHSRNYRRIQFQKLKIDVPGKVKTIEYDPNRTANILGILYKDGSKAYQIAPMKMQVGDPVFASPNAPLTLGNSLPLGNIPLGTNVYNIESAPGKGGQYVRSAGTKALLIAKSGFWVTLRLPSKEVRYFSKNCWATIGQVSQMEHLNRNLKKAGRSRWLGWRPRVRGSAKNPVDHPHGGGEGKAPIGKSHPVTPWGKPALGQRTRKPKKYSDALILRPSRDER